MSKSQNAVVQDALTPTQNVLRVCNDTVTVYFNGFPQYTIIGEGCLTIPIIANNFTLTDNKVFFWNLTSLTLMSEGGGNGRAVTFPMWAVPTAALLLRALFSKRAAL